MTGTDDLSSDVEATVTVDEGHCRPGSWGH